MADETPPAGKDTPTPAAVEPKQEANVTPPEAETPPQGEQKAATDAKTQEPVKYELKLPADALVDKSDLERIEADAKARGLSAEEAQSILDRENSALASFVEKQKKQTEGIVTGWKKAVEADKEIGGANFPKNAEIAKRAVDRFGSQEFKQALEESGLGNHPELVRVFYKIGKAMENDEFLSGQPNSIGKKSPSELLYGK